ncbi:MAG TPA: ATP-dependent sacrificial sulfur transferase LarE [Candidatus Blautia excrementipullorum]|nr:ATP-dependent sacrificial sulfur transferase LarE [Candidatus Blautia excrementipullorum]
MVLKEFFQKHPKAALGFSGGVDSAFLLYAGKKYGADIRPYFIKTAFQPEFELQDALRLTKELGTDLAVIECDILAETQVAENPPDRCYYCKSVLFGTLKRQAAKDGYEVLLDGTNASDEASDRPGMQAVQELKVLSPLRECGLSKTEIRRLSREAGLFTWEKPSYACLATRVPSGELITEELLEKIEKGEAALTELGFSDFRIRLYHKAARIQLPEQQLDLMLQNREAVLRKLEPYFDAVMLDLGVRESDLTNQ